MNDNFQGDLGCKLPATPSPSEAAMRTIAGHEARVTNLLAERDALAKRVEELEQGRDAAYSERNQLVALLASMFPAGVAKTAIEGWDEAWHGCVYIDFPWGQASWHYHDSQAEMFHHLPQYLGSWDGHTTDQKYEMIGRATRYRWAKGFPRGEFGNYQQSINSTDIDRDARAELEGEGA